LIALWFTGYLTAGTYKMRKQEAQMKYITAMALMLNLGVASVYAQQRSVNMTFSGTNVGTTINLLPGTVTDELILAGDGTLGPFTYRELHADSLSPEPSSTCPGIYIPNKGGAGVFRFQDGSLLMAVLNPGAALCIGLTEAHFTGTYMITGGTGRFKGATGALTVTSTVLPVLFGASGPVLLTNTGEFTGTVSGVAREVDQERQ
jgi:hypothetical protein